MQRRPGLLLLLLAISACHRPAPVAPPPAPPASALIGTWGVESEGCNGDNALVFAGNGNWSAYRTGGSWQLKGTTLAIRTTRVENDAGQTITVAHPVEQRQQVRFPASDRLVLVAADGTATRMMRCR